MNLNSCCAHPFRYVASYFREGNILHRENISSRSRASCGLGSALENCFLCFSQQNRILLYITHRPKLLSFRMWSVPFLLVSLLKCERQIWNHELFSYVCHKIKRKYIDKIFKFSAIWIKQLTWKLIKTIDQQFQFFPLILCFLFTIQQERFVCRMTFSWVFDIMESTMASTIVKYLVTSMDYDKRFNGKIIEDSVNII